MPKRPRSSSRQKSRRKARLPAGVSLPARPTVAPRPRIAPVTPSPEAEGQSRPKPRVPGAIDFSYVGGELRRILIVAGGVIGLLIVLSFVLR